jgi:hypothetical protein
MAVLVVTVAVATTAVFVVLLLALLGHVRRLATALTELQRSVTPLMEDILEGSERARTRLDRMQDRRERLGGPVG